MTHMKNLVKQVLGGHTSFEPEDGSLDAMRRFQQVVATLLEAERSGYIQDLTLHHESDSGHDFCDCVVVGRATELGRSFAR